MLRGLALSGLIAVAVGHAGLVRLVAYSCTTPAKVDSAMLWLPRGWTPFSSPFPSLPCSAPPNPAPPYPRPLVAAQIIPTSRNAFDRNAPGFAYDGGKLATPCTCADKQVSHKPRGNKIVAHTLADTQPPTPNPDARLPRAPYAHGRPPLARTCVQGNRLCAGDSQRELPQGSVQTPTSVASAGAGSRACGGARAARSADRTASPTPKHPDNGGKIPTKAITGNAPHADKAGVSVSLCSWTDPLCVLRALAAVLGRRERTAGGSNLARGKLHTGLGHGEPALGVQQNGPETPAHFVLSAGLRTGSALLSARRHG